MLQETDGNHGINRGFRASHGGIQSGLQSPIIGQFKIVVGLEIERESYNSSPVLKGPGRNEITILHPFVLFDQFSRGRVFFDNPMIPGVEMRSSIGQKNRVAFVDSFITEPGSMESPVFSQRFGNSQ